MLGRGREGSGAEMCLKFSLCLGPSRDGRDGQAHATDQHGSNLCAHDAPARKCADVEFSWCIFPTISNARTPAAVCFGNSREAPEKCKTFMFFIQWAKNAQKPGRGTSDNPTIREILNLFAGNVGLPEAPAWFPLVMKPCERGRRKGTGI